MLHKLKRKIERHYDGRLVLCFQNRPNDFVEVLKDTVSRSPDKVVLCFNNKNVTYRELDKLSDQFVGGLKKCGVNKQDIIVLNLSNCIEFVIALFACFKGDFIAMPVGHRHKKRELSSLYDDAGVKAVIYDHETAIEQPSHFENQSTIYIGVNIRIKENHHLFESVLEKGQNYKYAYSKISETDPAILLYTSGTTGQPKGAILTHLGLIHSYLHFKFDLEIQDGDCTILAVPASHVTGLVAQILTIIGCGGKIVIMDVFDTSEYVRLARKHALTYAILVPAMYALLLHRNLLRPEGLSNWRIGAFGGAPMPDAVRKGLEQVLPKLSLHNAYGATETTSPTTIIPVGVNDPKDSVGKVVSCGEIRIIDEEGVDVKTGITGELLVKGPMVIPGYWKNQTATKDSFENGFWKSGDIASEDKNGFIRIHDRKKDMINRGGYKIFSAEIENLLVLIDGIQEAAVVSYPCPILGERAHAFVFTNVSGISVDDLKKILIDKVADYKVPDKITITNKPLPRNVNGKVIKSALREI